VQGPFTVFAPSAHDASLSMPPSRLEGPQSLPLGCHGVQELAPALMRGSLLPRQEASLLQGQSGGKPPHSIRRLRFHASGWRAGP